MQQLLELVERHLTHHRVQHVLDLGGQHHPPLCRLCRIQQRPERQHFPEHAGGFRQGQRRARHQVPLWPGQNLMHPMPKLMRQGHHIPRLAMIIQQKIRMRAGNRRMREGPTRLAGLQPCVDPWLVEEMAADRGQIRAEGGIGIQHLLPRLGPCDQLRRRRSATARCGPSAAASAGPAISPSSGNSGATSEDRNAVTAVASASTTASSTMFDRLR